MATATRGATCLGKTYTHWSCGRRDREEVLYEEQLAPGRRYVYRPDAERPAGRIFVLTEER